ncbi:MAG TPA: hypothetical protein VFE62_02695 [Gemmataceae bacterium]|nr:hypothetical protein [Gemmataceae bacterium]
MAFSPLHTFQKNRRFWMAVILGICMISFVFCTGFKGDMADRLQWIWRGGTVVAVVGNSNVTREDLVKLKEQRNVANEFMRNCNEIVLKKVSKLHFESEKKAEEKGEKNAQARAQQRFQLERIRHTLYERSRKQRYFDLGVKFDDLLEFKLWQAVADKLDIHLDDEHVTMMFRFEFFTFRDQELLDAQDMFRAKLELRRASANVNDAYIQSAIAEEFRVRIAQEAVLKAQPFQFFSGHRQQQGFTMKFTDNELGPEEIRAPLTLAQLWDAYKQKRSDFNVTLIPVHVKDFIAKIAEDPSEQEKEDFFKQHKDKPADPNAEEPGVQLPIRVKVDYVMADPMSKEYLGLARTVATLKTNSPIHLEAVQSPLAAAVNAMAMAQAHMVNVDKQYQVSANTEQFNYVTATPFAVGGSAAPIMSWLAKRHPEAIASMIGQGFAGPTTDIGSMCGFMAWGAVKHPDVLQAAMREEAERRGPFYAAIVMATAAEPLACVYPYFNMERIKLVPLPVAAVQHEVEKMLAENTAREWAQENMQTVRTQLEKAEGDPEKFRRALDKLVSELHLTYGPADKSVYFNRFTVDSAKELEPLKEAYLKSIDLINFYEARDVTPDRLLKPGDFQKLLFDSTESFAATTPYRVMAWPPKAKMNSQRVLKPGADPRLIHPEKLTGREYEEFMGQLKQQDPLRATPEFDMFKYADKPILFWRTAERIPVRPSEYADIERDVKKFKIDEAKTAKELKAMDEVGGRISELRKQQAELKKSKADAGKLEEVTKELGKESALLAKLHKEAQGNANVLRGRVTDLKEKQTDLDEIKRLIVSGWKFDRARSEKALPKAEAIAMDLITNLQKTPLQIAVEASHELKHNEITLEDLAPLTRENMPDKTVDYFKPFLKNKSLVPDARDDMAEQAVKLWEMKEPIKIDNKALDEVNKALFDKTRSLKKNEFVQILTDKGRSVFYVAFVSVPPRANQFLFQFMMKGSDPPLVTRGQQQRQAPFDHFAERIQEDQAKAFRANVVAYLHNTLGYRIDKPEIAKDFDERQ